MATRYHVVYVLKICFGYKLVIFFAKEHLALCPSSSWPTKTDFVRDGVKWKNLMGAVNNCRRLQTGIAERPLIATRENLTEPQKREIDGYGGGHLAFRGTATLRRTVESLNGGFCLLLRSGSDESVPTQMIVSFRTEEVGKSCQARNFFSPLLGNSQTTCSWIPQHVAELQCFSPTYPVMDPVWRWRQTHFIICRKA